MKPMDKIVKIDRETAEAAVLGGSVLGGGGGGWIEEGNKLAQVALQNGFSEILPLEHLPDDAVLLTVSAVGAPSAGTGILKPNDYVRSVEVFTQKTGMEIDGLISSEIGALGVVNGWVQSAFLKIPVIDSPCNGRAHPLGLMGSMGLHKVEEYVSMQAVVGRKGEKGEPVELFFKNSLEEASQKILETARETKGMVAVARNPVQAKYVKQNGAPGSISMAIELGRIMLKNKEFGFKQFGDKILSFFGGDLKIKGKVIKVDLQIAGGLDVGKIDINVDNRIHELAFWNEYMTLEDEGKRIATFPDLIMTFDAETNHPVISAAIKENQEIVLLVVSKKRLILGEGVKDRELLKKVEKTIIKKIAV